MKIFIYFSLSRYLKNNKLKTKLEVTNFFLRVYKPRERSLRGINMFRKENRSLPWPVMMPFGELLWLYLLWSMGPRAMDSGLSTEWGMTVNRRSMNKYSHWNISSSDPPMSAILQWKLSSSPTLLCIPSVYTIVYWCTCLLNYWAVQSTGLLPTGLIRTMCPDRL